MKKSRILIASVLSLFCLVFSLRPPLQAESLREDNEILFEQLRRVHHLTEKQMDSIRAIFRESGYVGQGNPAIARHPLAPGD